MQFKSRNCAKMIEELKANPLVHLLGLVDSMRFVVKDREHRYLYVNRIWQESFGYTDENAEKVLGKTANELFPKWRAQRYIEEEEVVMRERLVQDYEEYQFNADGVVERWRTIKAPWVVDDEVIGYINLGISMGGALERRQDQLPPLVQELMKRACTHQSIDDICKELGVSRRTFERRFRAVMNETPQQFRLKCRLVKAKQLLVDGGKVIEVAEECGFNDQSHFSRAFSKFTGLSPKKFQSQGR